MKFTAEERETIAAENIKLVYFVVNKYKVTKLDESELESLAFSGYGKAVLWFDDSKGLKFSTYAVTLMCREIASYMREEYKKRGIRNSVNLDYATTNKGEGKETSLHELIGCKENDFELFELINCIENIKLDENEKQILHWIIEGDNQREITRKLENRSRTWVWSKMQNIRKKLNFELRGGEGA